MIDTIINRLNGKKILIAGFGREGKSTLRFLQKYLPDAMIGIADKNESAFQDVDKERYELFSGDDYLNAAAGLLSPRRARQRQKKQKKDHSAKSHLDTLKFKTANIRNYLTFP